MKLSNDITQSRRAIKLFGLLCKWVVKLSVFGKSDRKILIRSLNAFTRSLLRSLHSRGCLDTIRYLKELRVSYFSFLAGTGFIKEYKVAFYKNGVPKWFGPDFKEYYDKFPMNSNIQFCITVLSVSRVIKGWKAPSIKPLVMPSTCDFNHKDYHGFIQFIRENEFPWIEIEPWSKPHKTTKMGPNGPALDTATKDYELFEPRYRKHLANLHGQEMEAMFERSGVDFPTWPGLSRNTRKGPRTLRRLSFVDDKEGKKRVIGIVDYWSQSILKCFHDQVMKMLQTLWGDRTYKQTDFSDLGNPNDKFYSFDLSSATDRFPKEPQFEVVKAIHGDEFAKSWLDLMIGEPFLYKWGSYETNIKYGCGQPMGAYSSWAIFSLTHHMLVQYCGRKVGFDDFYAYYLLGDDIVIKDDRVAKEYEEMCKILGVEISKPKTLRSPYMFEFAKRVFLHGSEVSAFPIAGLVNTVSTWTEFITVLEEGTRRGYQFALSWDSFSNLWKILGKNGMVERFKNRSRSWYFMRTRESLAFYLYLIRFRDDHLLTRCLNSFGIYPSCNQSRESIIWRFKTWVVDSFLESSTKRAEAQHELNGEIMNKLSEMDFDIYDDANSDFPVINVLNEEIMDLAQASWTIYHESEEAYEKALYEDRMILGSNPYHVIGQKSRVRAMMIKAKTVVSALTQWSKEERLALSYLRDPELIDENKIPPERDRTKPRIDSVIAGESDIKPDSPQMKGGLDSIALMERLMSGKFDLD